MPVVSEDLGEQFQNCLIQWKWESEAKKRFEAIEVTHETASQPLTYLKTNRHQVLKTDYIRGNGGRTYYSRGSGTGPGEAHAWLICNFPSWEGVFFELRTLSCRYLEAWPKITVVLSGMTKKGIYLQYFCSLGNRIKDQECLSEKLLSDCVLV